MKLHEPFLLAIIVFVGTGGELAVTRAMKDIGEVHDFSPRNLLRVLVRAFSAGWMWFGVLLMTVAFFALLAMLSWENVSFVIPVTALSYVAGALGGKFLLGERVTPMRWLGVLLVCLGVALVCVG
ncbi:MAG TPA: EamA family transporter [Candidatus Acidoferrales bacterium]|jgi:drug/metabolite transporter (DMT)-like permease|nr:EamA family transporter [Candidatus Acidoferrales bacterium]